MVEKQGTKKMKTEVNKLKDEVNLFLNPKRARFLELQKKKDRERIARNKRPLQFAKGTNPRVIAAKLNGRKGGLKTAARYSKEERAKWGSKAGNTTLAKLGKDFFKHIRTLRKDYPKKYHRKKK